MCNLLVIVTKLLSLTTDNKDSYNMEVVKLKERTNIYVNKQDKYFKIVNDFNINIK